MAKSARASSKKNNRQALRSKVFQPVVDERTERLHAKLMSTIESEIPSKVNKTAMDVDEAETDPNEAGAEMDVDSKETKGGKVRSSRGKVYKSTHKKPRNSIRFPARKTGKTRSKF